MKRCDVAIIGGGLTGLSAAYYLSKEGKRVIVLEKGEEAGGLVSSWDIKGYKIEKFYHHLSKNDALFVDFLKELGIEEKLGWKHGSVGYYYDNKVYKMDTPLDIFKFKGLNLLDIIRVGLIVLWVKLKRDHSDLDEISAREWLIKKSGERAYNNFFRPLLKSKFGKNLDEVSAAWLFGRIKFRSRRSFSGEKLGYMDHGFHELIEKVCSEIEKRGGEIITATEVKEINLENGSVSGVSTTDEKIATRCVISTIPPRELINICELPREFEERLKKIEYQRTICALFCLDKNLLEEVYWLNIRSETLPFGAIIEHTNFYSIPEYGGDHLVYVVSYVQDEEDELWKKDDKEIISIFVNGLRDAFPNLRRNHIKWWRLARGVYTGPIYKKGYRARMSKLESPIDGLFITGMFLMYPERSMNESVKLGREISLKINRRGNFLQ